MEEFITQRPRVSAEVIQRGYSRQKGVFAPTVSGYDTECQVTQHVDREFIATTFKKIDHDGGAAGRTTRSANKTGYIC